MICRIRAAVVIIAGCIFFGVVPGSPTWAQESNDAPAQRGEERASEVAESEPEFDSLSASEQIQESLKDGKPEAAARVLATALESKPDDAQLRQLHRSVATGFLRGRKYDEGTRQLMQLFEYELPRTGSPKEANRLSGLIQQVSVYGAYGDQAGVVAKATDQAIAKCRELESKYPIEIQSTLSKLIGLRASVLSRSDKSLARDLVERQIEKLETINDSDDVNEQTFSAAINLLIVSARIFGDTETETQLESLFQQALEEYPKSEALAVQLASHEYSVISGLARGKPEEAAQRMEDAVARLTPYAEQFRGVQSILRRMQSLESRIEAGRKQQAMIGKPAPPLDVDGWVNAKIDSIDDLKGKVVLYDFWAIWCGPCIATFPHLREWREEFGDQGFEIVGITRYYGYTWDEDRNQAVRSSEDLSAGLEQQAVEKFLQSKDMHHPTILTPKDSQLQSEYGVTGIPHAVLVDRQGNVQMVKVGSGQSNADALHAKIKELIAE